MFATKHAEDVHCTDCRTSRIAKQTGGMLQIKLGKQYIHTSSSASIDCWKCGTTNLVTIVGNASDSVA